MGDPEEHELIERIQNGDQAPFAILVDRYKYMAYTIANKVLHNEEDAEDIAQESFIKAYQQIRRFKGNSKFSTWLYTIVYRTAISQWNEKRVETISLSDGLAEATQPVSFWTQVDDMQSSDERRHIQAAIDRLPQAEGVLVTLYYINDNSIREIRDITGFSMANIKIKLFRARRKLERELRFLLEEQSKVITENGK